MVSLARAPATGYPNLAERSDTAVSLAAAQERGIVSPLAGQRRISCDAGSTLVKQITFMGGADPPGSF
jgi:hypothetical protein